MKEKILIIKMSALGDLFMALPHVDVILTHHPKDEVWLLTSPPYEELFHHHPRMNVTVLDRNERFRRNGTLGRVRWIRRQRFSVIYDLQGNRTSRLLVRFSNAKITVGTQPRSIYRFHPELPYTRDTRQNVFDRLNDTLTAFRGRIRAAPCIRLPKILIGCPDGRLKIGWRKKTTHSCMPEAVPDGSRNAGPRNGILNLQR